MAKRGGRQKGGTSTVNKVLAGVLIALVAYFVFGFFNSTPKKVVLPTATFHLPSVIPASSDDNASRVQIQSMQKKLKQSGDFTTVYALVELYRELATSALIKPTFRDVEWLDALSEFGRDTQKEDPRPAALLVKAMLLQQMLQTEKAAEAYEATLALLEPGSTEFTTYSAFAYDRLVKMQMTAGLHRNATQTVIRAIEAREDDQFVNRWYGFYLESLINVGELQRALTVADSCIKDLQDIEGFVPHNCLHQKALISTWTGDIKTSVENGVKNFELLVERLWRTDADDQPCSGTHYAMSYDHLADDKRFASPKLSASPVNLPDARFAADISSSQEYPYCLKHDGKTNSWSKGQLTGKMDRMHAYTLDDKIVTMYTIEDAVVKGSGKVISNDETCEVFTFGYPYQNTRLHPRLSGKDTYDLQSLPIKEVEEAVILPSLTDTNYYHFLIEGIAMPLLTQYTDLEFPNGYKLLVQPSDMTVSLLSHLKMPTTLLEAYREASTRFHVKKAHVIDWRFNVTSSGDVYHHPEDYYVPPNKVLYATKAMLLNGAINPGLNLTVARDAVVWTRRSSTASRSIGNWREVEGFLKSVCDDRGIEFVVHTGKETLAEQIMIFKRAAVVVGPHGAGLANIIFSEQRTAVIELASLPSKVSVYSRLSSAMGLEYWQVPMCAVPHYEKGITFSRQQAEGLARTLDYILSEKGFRSVCGEYDPWK